MDSQGINTTQEYEQKAIEEFQRWCQQHQPTPKRAVTRAFLTAREVAIGLTAERVLQLLTEHPEWIFTPPLERWGRESDIRELTRCHLVDHVENILRSHGLALVAAKRQLRENSMNIDSGKEDRR